MPLSLRNVKPVYVSRDSREMREISKNLEHYKNYTMVNIIRQLSNLSHQAEDIFTAIHKEATNIFHRTSNLRIKVKKLSTVVDSLDPFKDDDDLEGALQKMPFCSKNTCDNNMMDRNKLPKCVQDMYNRCEAPPNLEILTKFREDGKKSSDFYSNPRSFFDLWRSEQEKNISSRGDKKKRKPKQRPYQRSAPSVPTPGNYSVLQQKRKCRQLQADGKELAEINSDHIRAMMEQKTSKDGNDNIDISGNQGHDVYSEVALEAVPRNRSDTIAGGLLSALKKQGLLEQVPQACAADETDVVADLLQRQMDLSDNEDTGWDDDEWDEFEEDDA